MNFLICVYFLRLIWSTDYRSSLAADSVREIRNKMCKISCMKANLKHTKIFHKYIFKSTQKLALKFIFILGCFEQLLKRNPSCIVLHICFRKLQHNAHPRKLIFLCIHDIPLAIYCRSASQGDFDLTYFPPFSTFVVKGENCRHARGCFCYSGVRLKMHSVVCRSAFRGLWVVRFEKAVNGKTSRCIQWTGVHFEALFCLAEVVKRDK